jgi:hypothetical protein
VVLQVLLRLLDSLVPQHGQETLDVLLSCEHISSHFLVGSLVLPSEHIGLALHDCMLLHQELLPLLVSPEPGLNPHSRMLLPHHLVQPVSHLSHITLDMRLYHDKTLALTPELSSLCIYTLIQQCD